ncbi:cob(I)yrinic acid a c-diamide adenosyltransferase [Veillonella montpellierensis DNF00314]|uniref:Cob(I)yrinic acid a c-diamide adenosyltransferase n=1 Tax=Veillonella montpellierensis DNF00314 TaxID=1401067 RepID=A0A096AMZ9_9FIRM|nr:cob(I)yrinic acid a,c-diamide adenosyltransferase [Veillonella montpellierensis]KGF48165.1 cob(I)yrinic acid a c-diamide adenosyltransferase [Veillonella montpellierensis DNF00314]
MSERGLILINTGDGKGKTTAALGVALRAVGQNKKVLILQFIKGGQNYGELNAIKRLAPQIEIRPMGKGFIFHNKDNVSTAELNEHKKAADEAWNMLKNEVNSDEWDLIILDEINYAMHYGLVSAESVIHLLKNKPERLDMILTGRNAPEEIIALADTVTEMKVVKHAYQKGIKAKRGIEF